MTSPTEQPSSNSRRTLVGVGTGHALEWYDWGIYAVFVPFFASQFFDDDDPASGVLASLAIFAVGFLARPLGGFLVGRLADRVGRRPMMGLTVGGMAAASLLIGLAPTYDTIGVGASALLVLARIIQGLATGGELPSAQTYLAESAPPDRRGLWSSVIYIASVGGNTVGVLLGLVLTSVLDDDQMRAWGWRVPFVIGGLLGIVALWIRRSLEETEAFTTQSAPPGGQPSPRSTVRAHKRQALQVVGMTVGPTVVYYTWLIAAPAYAISSLGIDARAALTASVVASLVMIAILPLWGALSDRVGRKPVLLLSCVGTALLLFPLQTLVRDSAWQLGVAMIIALVFIGAGVAVLPTAYAELFPTSIRTVGLAVPYSLAVAVFGGTAPYLQTWVGDHVGRTAYTGYVVLLLAISAVTVATLREGRTVDLLDLRRGSDEVEVTTPTAAAATTRSSTRGDAR